MEPKESNSFKALKECARNIDIKLARVERELLCPSSFGDPLKAAASEEFLNQRIQEVVDIKEHLKKLTVETRLSLEVQKKFNEELSGAKNSLIQQVVEVEHRLQKYGYEPIKKHYGNLLSNDEEEEESCDDSNKITDDTCTSQEEVVTKNFEDLNLSYKECLTPYVSVSVSGSNTKVSSNHYIPRKLVDNEATESKSASVLTKSASAVDEIPTYSESFYELERKYQMYKKRQKEHV